MYLYNSSFIYTSMLDIERDEDKINIALEYTMDVNGQQMSECKVRIEICNQNTAL